MTKSWFNQKVYNLLEVTEYKTLADKTVVAQIKIQDLEAIKKIQERIEKIPADGKTMNKPGPNTKYMTLSFADSDNNRHQIEILNNQFKTPSTGFNDDDPEKRQGKLIEDLLNLLHPALGHRLLKIKDLRLDFRGTPVISKDFSIEYKGTTRNADPALTGGPTIGPTATALFTVIIDAASTDYTSFEGQVPPQPIKFKVGFKKFTLSLYGKEGIYPEYFEVF